MQRLWLEDGPPVYISVAQYLRAMSGKAGPSPGGGRARDDVGTPEDLLRMFEGAGGLIS
jgi:hypothetical protein